MIRVTGTISLAESEISLSFIRSPGPGGQNVNKVATACQLKFDAAGSPSLPEEVKRRLRPIAGKRMTDDGVIVLTARRHRTQARNRDDALDRLLTMLRQAAAPPPPKRRATRPTLASKRRRLDAKKRRGETKRLRGRVKDE